MGNYKTATKEPSIRKNYKLLKSVCDHIDKQAKADYEGNATAYIEDLVKKDKANKKKSR